MVTLIRGNSTEVRNKAMVPTITPNIQHCTKVSSQCKTKKLKKLGIKNEKEETDEQFHVPFTIQCQGPQPNFISSTSLSAKFTKIKCFYILKNTN